MLADVHNRNGFIQIAKREFYYNIKSGRTIVLLILMTFTIVGGSYGVSKLAREHALPVPENSNIVQGPDFALFTMTTLIAFIVTLMALILSFDAFTRELQERTLDILLIKPFNYRLIALAKFTGIWLAAAVPLFFLSVISLIIIRLTAGEWPSFYYSVSFVVITLVLTAITILIQMTFSNLSSKTGTALALGVMVWLIMTVFWPVLPMAVGYVKGYELSPTGDFMDYNWTVLNNRMDLTNPVTAYQLCFTVLGKDIGLSSAGIVAPLPFISMGVWFILSLVLMIYTFSRRVGKITG